MLTRVNEPISVNLWFDCKNKSTFPTRVTWKNHEYKIAKIGFHHSYRSGRTLFHIFSAVSEGCCFKLIFNTETLIWELEEVYTD